MARILIIDDTPFWRDVTADILRGNGHTVCCASDGIEGLNILRRDGADLIVLDVEMPRMPGLAFLSQMRVDPQWKTLPVIMLTGDMVKDDILRAKKLGALDYILKSRFDARALIDRINKQLKLAAQAFQQPAGPAPPALSPPPLTNPKQLLTREQSLERAGEALRGKTLSGVVAQVIAMADSSRAEMTDLAALIGRDALLTARVLQTANGAAYAGNRAGIPTLQEAVRIIGSTAVRQIAASVGVLGAMPTPEPDGFNPIHCWQHSLAVATLCNHLVVPQNQGIAYVVGLCHNLGEVLFRTHFGPEYRLVLEVAARTARPRREVEKQMLGITSGELAEKILDHLELPPKILSPIVAYLRASASGQPITDSLAHCRAGRALCQGPCPEAIRRLIGTPMDPHRVPRHHRP